MARYTNAELDDVLAEAERAIKNARAELRTAENASDRYEVIRHASDAHAELDAMLAGQE